MSRLNGWMRRLRNIRFRKRLKNHSFTIFASNCNGTMITHDLGEQFRSPFVNLWIPSEEFVRFLEQPRAYLEQELRFIESSYSYPVAKLGDITLYFQHYENEEQALQIWNRRKDRIHWDNLFVMMTDRDQCTAELLKRFDALPYANKVVFTHVPMADIASAVYIPGFEDQPCVGVCSEFTDAWRGKRYYDSFDFVSWLNGEKNAPCVRQ